jgi:superkiller protein 3
MHGNPASALAVLSSQQGENLDDERDDLGLKAVAESAKRGKEAVRLAQKAVKMTPWCMKNWEIMSFARAAAR